MASSRPPPNAVPWIAITTGLLHSSMRESKAGKMFTPLCFCPEVTFPNSLMSAPATKVFPPPISTAARMSGSSAICAMASEIPSGTPGLNAFTGGLFIVIMAMSVSLLSWTRLLMEYLSSEKSGLGADRAAIEIRVASFFHLLRQESEHCPVCRLRLVRSENMAGVGNHHELCAGNPRGDELPISGRHQPVPLAMDYQGGRRDLVQAAVRLPTQDCLQLAKVTLRSGKPFPADCQVFLDFFERRSGVIHIWPDCQSSLFGVHARHQNPVDFGLSTDRRWAASGGAAQNERTNAAWILQCELLRNH